MAGPKETHLAGNALQEAMADLQAGRWSIGAQRLRGVLAANPRFAEVWSNLGFALRQMGQLAEAREALQRAVEINPGLADSWNLLGLVAHDQRAFEEALGHYDRAIALQPDFAYAWMNRANARQALGRHEEALADYARALQLAPDHARIHYNLGHLEHKATGELARAISHYRDAIRIDPGYATAHHNLSHALFLRGDFAEAWRESALRPSRMQHHEALSKIPRGYVLPAADRLNGRRIVVIAEQGLGDILFYLRFAPALRALGARLDFAGPPRLHAMLGRTGLFEAMAAEPRELATDAFQVLAGDLPLLLQPSAGDGVRAPPLPLVPDAARLEATRDRLRALGPPPYTTVAWRSGEPKTGLFETLFKELPFDVVGRTLGGMPGTLLSVQRQPRDGETQLLAAHLGRAVHDLSALNADLEDCLALMAAVDGYAGVSSTLVHLRASTGGSGHIFVPFPWEWRWMAAGSSPWFPRMTVHRQARDGSWPE